MAGRRHRSPRPAGRGSPAPAQAPRLRHHPLDDPLEAPPITPRPVLELHVDRTALHVLRPGDHPGWAEILRELQEQDAAWRPPDPRTAEEVQRRVPPPALARWIQMRDRGCAFPPCRASSVAADIDHTVAVTAGGPTAGANLGPLCRHDHRLEHEAGWRLEQTAPGTFTWISPTGHTYRAGPPGRGPRCPATHQVQPTLQHHTRRARHRRTDLVNDPYPSPGAAPDPDADSGAPGRHGRPDDPPF